MKRLYKAILIVLGTLSLILGITGIFLPLLPTTPFLLLTAACYVRSSERFYLWLIKNRFLGSYIKNYRDKKGIPLKTKVIAIILLWASILYSVFAVIPIFHVKLLLLGIALAVTSHLLILRTLGCQLEFVKCFEETTLLKTTRNSFFPPISSGLLFPICFGAAFAYREGYVLASGGLSLEKFTLEKFTGDMLKIIVLFLSFVLARGMLFYLYQSVFKKFTKMFCLLEDNSSSLFEFCKITLAALCYGILPAIAGFYTISGQVSGINALSALPIGLLFASVLLSCIYSFGEVNASIISEGSSDMEAVYIVQDEGACEHEPTCYNTSILGLFRLTKQEDLLNIYYKILPGLAFLLLFAFTLVKVLPYSSLVLFATLPFHKKLWRSNSISKINLTPTAASLHFVFGLGLVLSLIVR